MSVLGAIDPCVADFFGELTINGVSMHTPAWNVLDISPLWMPPATRGSNVVIPHVPGQRAYPLRIDQTDYSLPMMFSGAVDQFGNVDPDGVYARLYRNLQDLQDFVFGPVDGVTRTWHATIDMPWGDVLEAEVQVLAFTQAWIVGELTKGTMELRVVGGRFEPVVS